MAINPDDILPRPRHSEIVPGQDLSTLSEHELVERITVLEAEIVRCRTAITERQATRDAASAIFRTR